MSYDPKARRDTPLALKLKDRIRRDGPLTIADYMQACLQDPEHGYYRTKAAIGRDGDFITAPEISQTFGELIGLWCAVVWQQMGMPKAFHLIELGPGHGTLMSDVLRATRRVPGFLDACTVVLVETNAAMIGEQRRRLDASVGKMTWTENIASIPDAPAILIANEFLDVLPIVQLQANADGWQHVGVGLDGAGHLDFQSLTPSLAFSQPLLERSPIPGQICELRETHAVTSALNRLARSGPLAALFVDYGHFDGEIGDTLQAVRGHRFEHPLTSPGEADLTSHVDFAAFGREAQSSGLTVDGPVTQAEFLGALGISERASRLMAANPEKAGEIEMGVARLMAPIGMGGRFKVIGVRLTALPPLPGFPDLEPARDMR